MLFDVLRSIPPLDVTPIRIKPAFLRLPQVVAKTRRRRQVEELLILAAVPTRIKPTPMRLSPGAVKPRKRHRQVEELLLLLAA
jgi:hypothetical protein